MFIPIPKRGHAKAHFRQGTPALPVGTELGSPTAASAPALDGLEKSREPLPSWKCPPTQDMSCPASTSFKRRVGGSLGPSLPSGHLGSPDTQVQGAVWIWRPGWTRPRAPVGSGMSQASPWGFQTPLPSCILEGGWDGWGEALCLHPSSTLTAQPPSLTQDSLGGRGICRALPDVALTHCDLDQKLP